MRMAIFDVPSSPLIDIGVASSLCSYNSVALKNFVHIPFNTDTGISAGYISARRVVGSTDVCVCEYDRYSQFAYLL